MKLFRFMSKKEFEKFNKGEVLINNKKHTASTNSVGFCFMECNDYYDAEYSYKYLAGIVSDDICVVFETDEKLNKTWGKYADPNGSNFFDYIIEDEYCITKYSNKTFKIIGYAKPKFFGEWEWVIKMDKYFKYLLRFIIVLLVICLFMLLINELERVRCMNIPLPDKMSDERCVPYINIEGD